MTDIDDRGPRRARSLQRPRPRSDSSRFLPFSRPRPGRAVHAAAIAPLLAALAGLGACKDESGPGGPLLKLDAAGAQGGAGAAGGASGSGGARATGGAGGTGGGAGAGASGGAIGRAGTSGTFDAGGTSSDGAARDGAGPSGFLPCAVEAVLKNRCQHCHTRPPRLGAPVPLDSYADTQAIASDGKTRVPVLMKTYVESGFMPLYGSPTGALTAAEKTTLLGWLDRGSPPDPAACAALSDAGTPDVTPTGPAALPCKPQHEFRAHGLTAADPFAVPLADNTYRCFAFQSPFKTGEQGIAWAPILGDTRVLHHWILYSNGATRPLACNDPNRVFLMGWAPGGQNWVMPSDVGLELPAPGTWLQLEVHYNNKARFSDARDRSGVAVCTTDVPRPKVAGVMTFGSVAIDLPPGSTGQLVAGDCPPILTQLLPQPLRILASFPHMHQLGTRFRTQVTSAGATRTLVEIPSWDFNNQRSYPYDAETTLIRPGDGVRVECTYSNPTNARVRFGGATEDEMCFDFMMAYPIPPPNLRRCVR